VRSACNKNLPSCGSSTQGVQDFCQAVTHDIVVIGNVHEATAKLCDNTHHDDAHKGNISGPIGVLRNNTASVFPSCCKYLLLDPEWKVDILQIIGNVGRVVPTLINDDGFVVTRLFRLWFGLLIVQGKKVLFSLSAKSLSPD
jgi:hypothetical protein